jgi:hypothetical protein
VKRQDRRRHTLELFGYAGHSFQTRQPIEVVYAAEHEENQLTAIIGQFDRFTFEVNGLDLGGLLGQHVDLGKAFQQDGQGDVEEAIRPVGPNDLDRLAQQVG